MANAFDYLDWRGDLSFRQAGCNEVDNVILSDISYIDFGEVVPAEPSRGISLAEAAPLYFARHPRAKNGLGVLLPDETQDLLQLAAQTTRFGQIKLWGYTNVIDKEKEMQFSAICYDLDNSTTYVAFRGTDNSIVGWKENFNMSYQFPVPAQEAAADYLKRIASLTQNLLIVGGHSKGGNLAVYAAAYAPEIVQNRIDAVWSNDGPGFRQVVFQTEGYQRIRDRVTTILPVASVVGILLHLDSKTITVDSSAHGPMQHSGLTWQVMGARFVESDASSRTSRQTDEIADALMEGMRPEDRKNFINTLYRAINDMGVDTLSDIAYDESKWQTLQALYHSIGEFEPATKEHFLRAVLTSFQVDDRIVNRLFSKMNRPRLPFVGRRSGQDEDA